MNRIGRTVVMVLVALVGVLCGCGTKMEEAAEAINPGTGKTIGMTMPTQYSERWIMDCENMKVQLEELGYTVFDQFADDDVEQQIAQIEGFIEQQVDCLVIAAVDSMALRAVEDRAKEEGIPIVAYDRLLMGTDAVSFYATFDNKCIGTEIAKEIVAQAKLEEAKAAGKSLTVEFFMGSPDDNNAIMLYQGLMEVIQPYLDDGTLICKSGKTSFEDTCILRWSEETAQEMCAQYLATYYTEEELDICVSAFDGFAYGCITALENAGYTEENWPIISGQDADLKACKNILNGKQTCTIYKDTRVLAEKCVTMVNAVCNGTIPEINDTEQYNNGVITVPTYLCTPISVNKDNLNEIIIDSGYYTEEQVISE